jgi:TolB-like protein/DNA-binding winged helix-turn-helix (wHTH) protein/tetratricopeptide (TPR) repeat protein
LVHSPSSAPGHRHFAFGKFTFDVDRGALLHNGEDTRLRPQSYEVLRILLTNRGRLVTKDELQTAVWGNKVVTDDSLAQCVIDIRKALGDTKREMIRTIPRRGFIFEADVLIDGDALGNSRRSAQSRRNRRAILAASAALFIAVAISWYFGDRARSENVPPANSIAVMPFIDQGVAQTDQYVGDGLSEDILNSLAQHSALLVIARTSSFALTDTNLDVSAIRKKLNVAYVLFGDIERTGNRLAVSAQLVRTVDGSHVWSETFAIAPSQAHSVRTSIAAQIVKHIAPESDLSIPSTSVGNITSTDLMWLARRYEQQLRDQSVVDEELLAKTIQLYRDATVADPASAKAFSGLAGALLYQGDTIAAEAPIYKALTLDPKLSEVQETLGKFYWLRGLPGAGNAWKQAVELNPSNADALSSYGYWFWMRGNYEGVEYFFREALRVDPVQLARFAALGNFYGKNGRVEDTLDLVARIQAEFDGAAALRLVAHLLELIGRVDQSIAWTIRARDLEPGNLEHVGALAELYADIGDFETALRLEPDAGVGLLMKMRQYDAVIDLGEMLMIEEPGDIYLRYLLAFAYNVSDQPAAAVRILRSTGLPESAIPEARHAMDLEALVTLADALDAANETERGHALARLWIGRKHVNSPNWWFQFQSACPRAILGRDDEALDYLEQINRSSRLPWYFLFKDARCLQRYEDEPRYQAVLENIRLRQSELRDRLPTTLRNFGVSL